MPSMTPRCSGQQLPPVALCGLLLACGPGPQQNAALYEAAGDYQNASEQFMAALRRKPQNAAWRISLRRNAQLALDKQAERAAMAMVQGDHQAAQALYSAVIAYKERVEGFGITLDLAPEHMANWRKAGDAQVRDLYDRAAGHIAERSFREAEAALQEVRRIRPHYNDSDDLWNRAVYEQAVSAFGNNEWRTAYGHFARVASYQSVAAYMRQCLEQGRTTVALLPVDYPRRREVAELLQNSLQTRLAWIGDPFTAYVPKASLQHVMKESKHIRPRLVAEVRVTSVDTPNPVESSEKVQAWTWDGTTEQYTTEKGKAKKRAKPSSVHETSYTRVRGTKSVFLWVSVSVTESASSALRVSDTMEASSASEVDYARYSGDISQLYDTKPGDQGKLFGLTVFPGTVSRDLFTPGQYASTASMLAECVQQLVPQLTDAIARASQ
jgi:hypothetical protein